MAKLPFRKKIPPTILVASRNAAVLDNIPPEFQVIEAVTTHGVLNVTERSLPTLLIVDVNDLVETRDLPHSVLQTALDSVALAGVPVVNSDQFLAESQQMLGKSLLSRGRRTGIRFMPPRAVLITNYCGGVGKTTLALAMAKRFRKQAGLSVAVLEGVPGASALNARLGGKHPSLYEVVTQNAKPEAWEEVDIYSLDGREAQVLERDRHLFDTLHAIARSHTLTLFDVFPGTPLWAHALTLVSDILVVAVPRPDAMAQTEAMLQHLRESLSAVRVKPHARLVLNMTRSLGERLLLGDQLDASLPYDERRARDLDHSLADPLIAILYPGWSGKEKSK